VPPSVAAFTDTYHPTVNGVTYALDAWRAEWLDRDGRMAVVYPRSSHEPRRDEHPVPSVPFPFYAGFRVGPPLVPDIGTADLVHAHTPFGLGLAARRFAGRRDRPLVATYHTPIVEYADYAPASRVIAPLAEAYERWYYDRVDLVLVPSETTRERIESRIQGPTAVVPNGIDLTRFEPMETNEARRTLDTTGIDLPAEPLIGYTGRHGAEKRVRDLVDAAAGVDATLVIAGDGPERAGLESRAAERGVGARFLGFLDRDLLPAFYAALDVFALPSPVETQGLVAVEAMACGTPVVGADAGALVDTIDAEVGVRFTAGDVDALRDAIQEVLKSRGQLRSACLDRRDDWGIERSTDRLESAYRQVL